MSKQRAPFPQRMVMNSHEHNDGLKAIYMILQASELTAFDAHAPQMLEFAGRDGEDFTTFLLALELFSISLETPEATQYTILKLMLKDDAKTFLERWEQEQQQHPLTRTVSDHATVCPPAASRVCKHQPSLYQAAVAALESEYVDPVVLEHHRWLRNHQLIQYTACLEWVQLCWSLTRWKDIPTINCEAPESCNGYR